MLGYKSTQSSCESLHHHKQIKAAVPKEYHNELDCAYDWIKTRNFRTAMDTNTVESWQWLKTSMINPPIKVIEKFSNEATKHVCIESHIPPVPARKDPCCRLCKKSLAENVYKKIKFSMIICQCDKLWCHSNCADQYILKSGQCSLCKDYFILSPYCSSLLSTFVSK